MNKFLTTHARVCIVTTTIIEAWHRCVTICTPTDVLDLHLTYVILFSDRTSNCVSDCASRGPTQLVSQRRAEVTDFEVAPATSGNELTQLVREHSATVVSAL